MLKEIFSELLTGYTDNDRIRNELWTEVESNYSSNNRHYHTLQHLESLLRQLRVVKSEIDSWETILFTLFYHDVIYNSERSDNEKMSARLAEKRMKQILVNNEVIERCTNQILATKSHNKSTDSDTNYFTDADLSILGQNWETYLLYSKNVRKEFSIYPDVIYNPARANVLHHFMSMDRIFKTDYFYDKFESQAKLNLQQEFDSL